jgi:glutamate racemase
VDGRAGGLGEELGAQADAEDRRLALERPHEEAVLVEQPRVPLLLVRVHAAAEDEDGVRSVRRLLARGDRALDELVPGGAHLGAEDAWSHARAVGECEHLHPVEHNRPMDTRPIGVFDSGVGGLTVLHECLVTLPHEDFAYLGDAARLPYGPRPLAELRRFAREIGLYLEAQDVKLVVVACNSATAAALPELQTELRVPVVGVITPEAHAAVQATRNRRIGLLATQATVTAGRYTELVRALDAGAEVVAVACPRLVPLIEGADPFGEETADAVREYAAPLKEAGVDTVILGCTHYPLIRPILQRVFGRDVTLVFSAEETAREVAETLARKRIENDAAREGAYRFLTTGDPAAFREMGRRFLQLPIGDVEHVEIAALEAAA